MIASTDACLGRSRKLKAFFFHGCIFLFFAIVTAVIAYTYISHENSYYYWDYATYHDTTAEKTVYFRNLSGDSPISVLGEVLRGIWESTARDYSDLHTLPIVPIFLFFGSSRIVYILTLALVYLLPFALVVGAIATRLVPSQGRSLVFWAAVSLTLLLPTTWIPTLRGYPDTLSAALIGLAIYLYVQDMRLPHAWQSVAIGLCVALAILLRRHFIYAGIALFAAITLQVLLAFSVTVREEPGRARRGLLTAVGRVGFTAACVLAFLCVLGWPFVERVIRTDFSQLYASYAVPISRGFEYYQSYFGWIASALALVGFLGAIKRRTRFSPIASFLLLFSAFSAGQWLLVVRQLGLHYTLHFTWGILFGFIALVSVTGASYRTNWRRLASGLLISVYFVFNFLSGLSTTNVLEYASFGPPYDEALQSLFSLNHPPLVRSDQQELVRLIDYLRDVAAPSDPIFVAASSFVLNDDLLWHGQHILHEPALTYPVEDFWLSNNLRILRWVPFADSRDEYPLEQLLSSQYVVVASPFQHHLAPDEQEVLGVVVHAFTQNWEFAQDFSALPRQFMLADDVTVTIYQRIRATPLGTTLRTLQAMQNYVTERPGGQVDLIKVNGSPDSVIIEATSGTFDVALAMETGQTSLLYLERLTERTELTGRLGAYDSSCIDDFTLRAELIDERGQQIASVQLMDPGPKDSFFHVLQPPQSAYLLFTLAVDNLPESSQLCWLVLNDVAIKSKPDYDAGFMNGLLSRASLQKFGRKDCE